MDGEPGKLQSMMSQRVVHIWACIQSLDSHPSSVVFSGFVSLVSFDGVLVNSLGCPSTDWNQVGKGTLGRCHLSGKKELLWGWAREGNPMWYLRNFLWLGCFSGISFNQELPRSFFSRRLTSNGVSVSVSVYPSSLFSLYSFLLPPLSLPRPAELHFLPTQGREAPPADGGLPALRLDPRPGL